MKNLKKSLMFFVTVVALMMVTTITTFASEPTYSANWYQESNGTWKIKDGNGVTVKNAWLCDDVVPANGKNVWYLLDANGNMVSAGLVQDGTGNYYSIETNHSGYYGMLRYKSGTYDGIYLELESQHSGSFAAIKNADGIEALKAKYGLTKVSINNDNCVYTSSFAPSPTSSTPNVSVGVSPKNATLSLDEAKSVALQAAGTRGISGSRYLEESATGLLRIWGKANDYVEISDILCPGKIFCVFFNPDAFAWSQGIELERTKQNIEYAIGRLIW